MHIPGALPLKHSQITNSKENITRGNVNETLASKKSGEGGDIENCNLYNDQFLRNGHTSIEMNSTDMMIIS